MLLEDIVKRFLHRKKLSFSTLCRFSRRIAAAAHADDEAGVPWHGEVAKRGTHEGSVEVEAAATYDTI